MKISIVVPVYNEADSLKACLESIAKQTKKAYEVIVVDNNSTDCTQDIARQFSFVTLIEEPRQGVVHARTSGFNRAHGDIIARIDADTILPANWLSVVESIFQDENIDAVSGLALYYGVAAAKLASQVDLFLRRRVSASLKKQNKMYLWGANMAMRREAWQATKAYLCHRSHQHEDFDLAIHLQKQGFNIIFHEGLQAMVSSRRIGMSFIDYMHYVMMSPKTYSQHNIGVKKQMYPVVFVCAVFYLPGYILYKGYNPITQRFSLSRLFLVSQSAQRVDPTIFVA